MPLTFESLPREIRDPIYEYSLVTEKELVPFPCKQTRYLWFKTKGNFDWTPTKYLSADEARKELALGLLGANHRIREEAMEVYCSRNTFRLSRLDSEHIKTFWLRYSHLFRHLIVGDELPDSSPEKTSKRIRTLDEFLRYPIFVTKADLYAFHQHSEVHYFDLMPERFEIVEKMNLKTLQLGLSMNTCLRRDPSCTEYGMDGKLMVSCNEKVKKVCEKALEQQGILSEDELTGDPDCQIVKFSRLAQASELYGNSAVFTMVVRKK